ncbi:gem-associated protein 7 [Trematomus bernacchii]|uniref:Gem-associated protein 7 n=2 Tax=Nototheniidae TaxID=8206 RepID=A0A6I9N8A1_9TELE|nr:PREDICTED: gem-associated protein 7 [Notothenia coriiceps]XP_033970996.1 gem-associated protein 7 [Trematomus bernacchii]
MLLSGANTERFNMATPVSVLRLPKGPDPNSRGFDPKSPRFIALCRTSIATSASSETNAEQLPIEQHARSVLRETFLRCLLSMTNKKVQFLMHERVKVEATFGASDIDVLNFQVSDLHTPIGVQKEALIRCQDVISFTFDS